MPVGRLRNGCWNMVPKKHEKKIDSGGRVVQIAALALLAFMFYLDINKTENIDWAYYGVVLGIAGGADKRINRLLNGKN